MYYQDIDTNVKKVTLASIFGWMALALAVTSGVAIGIYLLLGFGLLPVEWYMPLLIASSIGYFITFIVINFRVLRNSTKSAVVPFFIYAAMMGVVMSSIMLYTAIDVIILAFLVSAVLFGAMAGYGYFAKRDLTAMGSIASMAFIGAFILVPILWFFYNETLYWIVTFVMFGAIMLITSYDVWMIKKQLEYGSPSRNAAVFFALRLYVDFINIFIRVVMFLNASRR